jgi:hypothetical protein
MMTNDDRGFTPRLQIAPDFQFINPGDRRIDDTYVAGVRVKIDILGKRYRKYLGVKDS